MRVDPASRDRASQAWARRRLAVSAEENAGATIFSSGSGEPPRVVVIAGIHGDEPEGVVAARTLLDDGPPTRGTLTIVPVCHERAFEAAQRSSPEDGRDLARTFPGDPSGGATQRLAAVLASEVLAHADVLIDLHTGGRHYDMPLLVGCADVDERPEGLRLARAFGAPYIWVHERWSPGRTPALVAAAGGVPLYVEAPGGEQLDGSTVRSYRDGVSRVLCALEMRAAPAATDPSPGSVVLTGSGNLDDIAVRTDVPGLFAAARAAGERVAEDETIGILYPTTGSDPVPVVARDAGVIVYLRKSARVDDGTALYAIAPVRE